MNKKILGIIIVITGLIIIALIIYYFFFFNPAPTETQINPVQNLPTNVVIPESNEVVPTTVNISNEIIAHKFGQKDLERLAISFTERFGSYSNQSNFGNIRDLKIFMTIKMQSWADNYIKEQSQKEYTGIYYGVTTKAISTEVKSFDESAGVSQILVKNQQKISTGDTDNTSTSYKNLLINFVKENGSWKADEALWQ
jgi:hypothetical protein